MKETEAFSYIEKKVAAARETVKKILRQDLSFWKYWTEEVKSAFYGAASEVIKQNWILYLLNDKNKGSSACFSAGWP